MNVPGKLRLPASPTPGSPTPFDGQAADFDRRVGLPEADCRHIAASVVSMAHVFAEQRLVDVGAGTGMIGRWFPSFRVRYVGLDVSRGMLEVFRRRPDVEDVERAALVQADARRTWPLPDGSVRAVFSSRAIHLLPREHVIGELLRVAPRGALVIGRVERPPESVKGLLSFEMRHRLLDRGFFPRNAGSRRLLGELKELGAEELDRREVARWPTRQTPSEALDQWRGKEGLGGIVLPPGVQDEILRELEAWALKAFGDLDAPHDTEEAYVLEGVSLPGAKKG